MPERASEYTEYSEFDGAISVTDYGEGVVTTDRATTRSGDDDVFVECGDVSDFAEALALLITSIHLIWDIRVRGRLFATGVLEADDLYKSTKCFPVVPT